MGISESALIGLACVLANSSDGNKIDEFRVSDALKSAEKIRVVEIMDSGSCLPMSLTNLIQETREGRFEIDLMSVVSQPCELCMASKQKISEYEKYMSPSQPCESCFSIKKEEHVHAAGNGQPCAGCGVSKELEEDLRELVKDMDLVGGKLVSE